MKDVRWISLMSFIFTLSDVHSGELKEYCFPHTFNASCPVGHIMLMEAARYGRMKKGRCLTTDYHIGCWADVLPQVDRMCSGRQACQINIPDTTLHMLQPCPKDMFAYLEASYDCIKVENVSSRRGCIQHMDLPLSKPSGYLSSAVTQELGYGSQLCPWKISLPAGQRLNLTLYDFGVAARFTQQGANLCHVYAKVKEKGLASDITICGSNQRQRGVFVSETNTIEIQITIDKKEPDPAYFLLHYQAIGCTNPIVPPGAWLKRTGSKAVISCNHTSQTWHIVCRGNQWVGTIDNCTHPYDTAVGVDTLTETKSSFPYGLLVAIIAGVILGIFIGVALLAVVMVCHRKRRSGYPTSEDTYMSNNREQQNPFLKPEQGYGYMHVCTLRHSPHMNTEHKPMCSCKLRPETYEKPMRSCHIHVDVKHTDQQQQQHQQQHQQQLQSSNIMPPPPPPQIPSFYGDFDGTNTLDIVRMTDQQQQQKQDGGREDYSSNSYLDSPGGID